MDFRRGAPTRCDHSSVPRRILLTHPSTLQHRTNPCAAIRGFRTAHCELRHRATSAPSRRIGVLHDCLRNHATSGPALSTFDCHPMVKVPATLRDYLSVSAARRDDPEGTSIANHVADVSGVQDMKCKLCFIALVFLSVNCLHAQDKADVSTHKIQFVAVDKDVKLEVVDWGGTGRPLVFLAGLGNDAHVYDKLAPQFIQNFHVYGITRRGFGASSKPAPSVVNYAADRLGDDVLAVIDALRLVRPVLIGHSIAGEELSSVGSRHPEKVGGLIYLDAANSYAFYDRAHGDLIIDTVDLQRRIDDVESGAITNRKFMSDMLVSVSQLKRDLEEYLERNKSLPDPPASSNPHPPLVMAVVLGTRKYTEIDVPTLAIFACPHSHATGLPTDPAAKSAVVANDLATCSAQADALQRGVPSARVIRLANADHYVFRSNEADVVREMNSFLATLP